MDDALRFHLSRCGVSLAVGTRDHLGLSDAAYSAVRMRSASSEIPSGFRLSEAVYESGDGSVRAGNSMLLELR